MLIAGPLSVFTPAKWYSRKLQLQLDSMKIADSLRVIDSIRIADSTRIADSCMLARYRKSDKMLAEEKKRKAERKAAAAQAVEDITPIVESDVDNFSARTIVIDPSNSRAKEIDSLQAKIDSLNNYIYNSDSRYNTMRTYALSEKKRYMLYLLRNKMKDTAAILICCNQLFEVYTLRQELLLAIRKSQDANTKTFIQYHIEEHQKKLAELTGFIHSLTPDVPFYPEKNRPEGVMEW